MKRAFILGNGPSLTLDQLKLLKDEVTFGVNQIHLLYEGVPKEWILTDEERKGVAPHSIYGSPRPFRRLDQILTVKHHVKEFVWMEFSGHDDVLWREAVGIHLNLGCVCHLSAGHRGHYRNFNMNRFESPPTRIEFYDLCQHGNNQPGEAEFRPEMWHLPNLCRYGGSLAAAMQIAVREGYGPLYLLGCDLGFTGEGDHFHPKYGVGARLLPADFQAERALRAHNVAYRSCPVPIYNCTPGGALDIYPRVSLEEVLYGRNVGSDTPDNRPDAENADDKRGDEGGEALPVGKERGVSRKKPGGSRSAGREVRQEAAGG